jgi:GGDEF domain-containing protein
VARFGGEEFVIGLRGRPEEAVSIMSRVQGADAAILPPNNGARSPPAPVALHDGSGPHAIITRADEYRAKRGKNRGSAERTVRSAGVTAASCQSDNADRILSGRALRLRCRDAWRHHPTLPILVAVAGGGPRKGTACRSIG